ncbi:hypothetical protein [Plantactinospora endophytica]|uniref:Cytochrome d ubiquinol oxidase subunit II n=1 Tax=Plantactinospora endophytica TaxID=673535 RepID=A0ABQ4EC70_9ACTN|nr:hypothetical protein [Plantactinospora endophytica]GIG92333.1 hypothetical protein Pen02_72690 [Plantactinospora endophytica]
MLRRLVPVLLTAAVVALGVAALVVRPATGTPKETVDYVVLAGVPGLRWEDVDPQTTPTLWRMAERGAIGSLSVRSARQPTCPVDGWQTLGAGNFAAWNGTVVAERCPVLNPEVEQPDGISANLPDQRATVTHNQDSMRWGTMPGALAESVRCTVAVGPGAAIAAARPAGRIDRYAAELPSDPKELLASCVLSIIDLGTVSGDDPAVRAAAARQADASLARVLAARPERSLVLVAGVSDTDRSSRLHVAVADGPGWGRGWLTSRSTGRDGYLQLVDLAPTALAALGRPAPERLFIGQPAAVVEGRPADLLTAIGAPADADREARAQQQVAKWFFLLLAGLQCLLAIAVLPLLRRARRDAGPHSPAPVPRRVVATVEVLLIAAALAIPAALVADAVPWWRGEHAGVYFGLVTAVVLGLATAAVRLARAYQRTLWPLGGVAALAAVIVGADVVTGARLQLNGVTGYSALEGGRYAGLGTVGLGVFIAGSLLSAGWLAQRVRRSWRPAVVVLVGVLGVIVVGSPYLGADAVGAVALTAGVSIAAAISTGGWLSLGRLAWAAIAGLAVTIGFVVMDLRQPLDQRGSLGRFLTAVGDGTSGLTVHRSGAANLAALAGSPLTVLALVGAVLVWFALLRPWGGLKRLFGIYPAIRAGMAGIPVAALIAGLLGGSALNVAGAAAALTVPMAALAALRVLDHAADRTMPPTGPFDEAPGSSPPPTASPTESRSRPVVEVRGEPAAPPAAEKPAAAAKPSDGTAAKAPDGTAAKPGTAAKASDGTATKVAGGAASNGSAADTRTAGGAGTGPAQPSAEVPAG